MYEGEGLGRIIIDLDAVLGEAASAMSIRGDYCFSIGRAVLDLYPAKTKPLLDRMDMLWRLAHEDGSEDEYGN